MSFRTTEKLQRSTSHLGIHTDSNDYVFSTAPAQQYPGSILPRSKHTTKQETEQQTVKYKQPYSSQRYQQVIHQARATASL